MPWLINAAQADKFRKTQKSLIILDASFHLPSANRDAYQEFLDKHIIGAQFFDIQALSDPNTSLPYMINPDKKTVSEKLSALGVKNDYKIIFYDNSDLHSACRAVWMMKVFGHNPQQLYILNGGLSAWEKYKGKIESGKSSVTPKFYEASFRPEFICTLEQMKKNIKEPYYEVIDVRHPTRFAGGKEARPHMRFGHIPGSISFPYEVFFEKGFFRPLEKIRARFASVTVDLKSPIISMCGSGVTAAILDFTLDLLAHKQHILYDGSWAEWGSDTLYPGEISLDERPVETCIEEDCPENLCP